MKKFKDKCEICGKWSCDCKGFHGKLVCAECRKEKENEK